MTRPSEPPLVRKSTRLPIMQVHFGTERLRHIDSKLLVLAKLIRVSVQRNKNKS